MPATAPAPVAPPQTLLALGAFPADDEARVAEMLLRRRLLNGEHEQDVKDAIKLAFGADRALVHQWVDVAANSYVQLWTTLAALYAFTPRVTGPDELAPVIAAVQQSGHWARMPRTQRDILALREVFILLAWDKETSTLQQRVITPDMFSTPRPTVADPNAIAWIAVWLRAGTEWQCHEYQIEDAAGKRNPVHRIRRLGGEVITEQLGDAYPFRDRAGLPIIPGVMYHAAETGCLLDWATGRDIVRGAVRLMVFYTGAGHVIIDASWLQRYSVNVEWAGRTAGADGVDHIIADPATVLEGTSGTADSTAPPLVGAFPQPADPEAIMRTIAMYARQLAASAGVRSPEATRTESDIRSGYSLAVSREAVQEMQAGYAPTFRRADQQLLHVASCLMGTPSLGAAEWGIAYQAIAMSPQEFVQRVAGAKAAMELGLMSQLDALLFVYPWLTVEEAQAKIDSGDLEPKAPAKSDPANNTPPDTSDKVAA